MFNPTAGDLLVYILATIYLIGILGLGAVRLANSGKGKLSALVFALFVLVSASNLLAFHSLQSAEKYLYWYASIHLAFWLLCAGMSLMYNQRLKHAGLVLATIGATIVLVVMIYVIGSLIIV